MDFAAEHPRYPEKPPMNGWVHLRTVKRLLRKSRACRRSLSTNSGCAGKRCTERRPPE
jgi:hypothetical protein